PPPRAPPPPSWTARWRRIGGVLATARPPDLLHGARSPDLDPPLGRGRSPRRVARALRAPAVPHLPVALRRARRRRQRHVPVARRIGARADCVAEPFRRAGNALLRGGGPSRSRGAPGHPRVPRAGGLAAVQGDRRGGGVAAAVDARRSRPDHDARAPALGGRGRPGAARLRRPLPLYPPACGARATASPRNRS